MHIYVECSTCICTPSDHQRDDFVWLLLGKLQIPRRMTLVSRKWLLLMLSWCSWPAFDRNCSRSWRYSHRNLGSVFLHPGIYIYTAKSRTCGMLWMSKAEAEYSRHVWWRFWSAGRLVGGRIVSIASCCVGFRSFAEVDHHQHTQSESTSFGQILCAAVVRFHHQFPHMIYAFLLGYVFFGGHISHCSSSVVIILTTQFTVEEQRG